MLLQSDTQVVFFSFFWLSPTVLVLMKQKNKICGFWNVLSVLCRATFLIPAMLKCPVCLPEINLLPTDVSEVRAAACSVWAEDGARVQETGTQCLPRTVCLFF